MVVVVVDRVVEHLNPEIYWGTGDAMMTFAKFRVLWLVTVMVMMVEGVCTATFFIPWIFKVWTAAHVSSFRLVWTSHVLVSC